MPTTARRGPRRGSHRGPATALCPIRLGEPCSLCVPGTAGPQDCGLVYLVMQDPDLRAELARMRAERAESGTSR